MKAGQEKKTERICPVCGKTYIVTDKRANTCGKSCGAKARLSRVTETCVCAYCGKVTPKTTGRKKYCSRRCQDRANRKKPGIQSAEKTAEMDGELVHIRIEREVGVEPDMQPEVGKVYRAKKIPGKTGFSYLIPGIGKYGLLVRERECVEV